MTPEIFLPGWATITDPVLAVTTRGFALGDEHRVRLHDHARGKIK
jgi:hypothetical protein